MPENLILYTSDDGKSTVSLFERDGSVWLNQLQMAELFATSKPNISIHIANVLKDSELDANSVVKDYLTTASDGKTYNIKYYSLEMIMAVGYRVRSVRGVQFRQWATRHLTEYLRKGFVIDDERLKNPDGRPDYFDELLARWGVAHIHHSYGYVAEYFGAIGQRIYSGVDYRCKEHNKYYALVAKYGAVFVGYDVDKSHNLNFYSSIDCLARCVLAEAIVLWLAAENRALKLCRLMSMQWELRARPDL